MSEMREILVDTAARLFGDLCTNERYAVAEKGDFNGDAWDALADAGLTRATVSEARGGDGADIGDALALVREAGRFALPLPLAETLVAELALALASDRNMSSTANLFTTRLEPLSWITALKAVLLRSGKVFPPEKRPGKHRAANATPGWLRSGLKRDKLASDLRLWR